MLRRVYPVVLSGGFGTRLWPASRTSLPKQFLKITGDTSPFQDALLRVGGLKGGTPPIVVANEEHRFIASQQALEIGIKCAGVITEPIARDTAAAVAAAALWVARSDPQALLLVTPADHHISPADAFVSQVDAAGSAAELEKLVVFGIKPRWPSPAFGYIRHMSQALAGETREVEAFVEKPEASVAAKFIETGNYLWNCGLVLARASVIVSELRHYRPDVLEKVETAVDDAAVDQDFIRLGKAQFGACHAISFDHAVLEKSKRTVVRELTDIAWSDIGTWAELLALGPRDEHGNSTSADVVSRRARNCFAYADGQRVVALVDVANLAVVSTSDVVFVGSLDSANELKALVQELRKSRPELIDSFKNNGSMTG